jgi:hypothetical protein
MKREVTYHESRYKKDMKERRISGVPTVHGIDPMHNRMENCTKALSMLKEALGGEWATDEPAITCGYARDQSPAVAVYPHIVALPSSTEEVQAVYRIANECLIDVMPYGTGISITGMTIPVFGGIVCDLRRMDNILEVDEENMFARVQPGVTFCDLQVEAQAKGLRTTNPSSPATSGVISNHMMCNINTMASKYGFGMDHIVETTAVLPNGDVLKTGPKACGMPPCHVPGPGPDMAPMHRYAWGTMGIITEMTVRLYPEPKHHAQVYAAFLEDRLNECVDALYLIAKDNLGIELAHLQNTFYGIFIGETNRESDRWVGLMPRNNIMVFVGGSTEEEAKLKAELTQRMVQGVSDEFQFVNPEFMNACMGYKDNIDIWWKYMRETTRVQRVRGSFAVGALVNRLDNLMETERVMRRATTDQIGTTATGNTRPDDASTYLQPYHMGRAAYMEYDLYTNQIDKDEFLRSQLGYLRATGMGLSSGSVYAIGVTPLFNMSDELINMVYVAMPGLATYIRINKTLKKAIDPNNISNRRGDDEEGGTSRIVWL